MTVSAELFELLVESVRDYAIFMLDPSGRVATWNPGAERIHGYRSDEVIGKHFSIFYPADDVRAGKCELELEGAEREGRVEDEGWRVRKDGTRFWADVAISAVRDRTGRLVGFAKVTRDLTERKRAEEDRAARLAAEQANRSKDEFLAMLGHELRNPLAPIATALQLMKLRGDKSSAREQQVIERQVRHMMRLIDDLLDVSKIIRGKIDLRKRRLDVREALGKAIEIASPLLEQRRIHLEVDAATCELAVEADESRLTQIYTNVIVNAAKFTPPGGHVTIAAVREDGEVVVTIHDDGIGIPPELLPKVFDPFVQASQSVDRSTGGLGIGLALVRRLLQLHGGTVEASSPGVDAGSTFTIRLPAVEAPTVDLALPPPKAAPPSQRRKVLVVDDNPDALTLLAEALTTAGHDVRAAPDPAAALQIVRHFTPDVAVLDIGLPVMDGYELAARLRAELGTDAPKMIALTGYGQPSDRERSERAGFSAHFVKPIDIAKLGDRIATLSPAA